MSITDRLRSKAAKIVKQQGTEEHAAMLRRMRILGGGNAFLRVITGPNGERSYNMDDKDPDKLLPNA